MVLLAELLLLATADEIGTVSNLMAETSGLL